MNTPREKQLEVLDTWLTKPEGLSDRSVEILHEVLFMLTWSEETEAFMEQIMKCIELFKETEGKTDDWSYLDA